MAACIVKTCPGNVLNPDTPHEVGDNECGYLNNDGTPLLKHATDPYTCRRPYCAHTSFTQEARDKHEADATKHRKKDMDFLCDWSGHADAINEQRICPVCQ